MSFELQHNVCGRSIYAEGTVDAAIFLQAKVRAMLCHLWVEVPNIIHYVELLLKLYHLNCRLSPTQNNVSIA